MASEYEPLRAACGQKKELFTGNDLLHAELSTAACRANVFAAGGFIRSGVTYSLFSILCAIYIASGYKALRSVFGQTSYPPEAT